MSEAISEEGAAEGYKQVQLGPRRVEIPKGWEKAQLGDLGEYLNGYGFKSSDWSDEGRPIIRIQNLTNSAGEETNYYQGEMKDRYIVHEGDLLVSWSATLGVFVWDGPEALLNQHIFKVEPSEKVSDDFLYYLLDQNLDLLEMRVQGSTMKHIRKSTFEDTFVPLPSLPEQRRIADILSTVDEQIQQTGEIIKKTKKLKRGLIQDIFDIETVGEHSKHTSEISLEGVQKKSLNDYVSVISGVHVKSDKVSDDETKTPYLTGPDDFDEFGFSVTKFTDDPSKFCEPGDTLVTVKGSGCGKTTFANKRASISRQLKALRPGMSIDEHYLYYWMQTKQELLSILAQGTSIPGLSTSDLTTLRIPVPSIEKQTRIGNVLSNLDTKIHQETQHKEKLKELKRGLMEDLFTGKVRVTTD